MQTCSNLRPVTPTSILSFEIEALCEEILARGWRQQSQRRLDRIRQIASGLDPYIQLCTTPHSNLLQSLVKATNANDWRLLHGAGETVHELESEMLSGHVEGQFLKFLISISNAKRVLEIGMFTGYATLAMAEALPTDGQIVACELDPFTAEFAKSIFERTPFADKISVCVGSAHLHVQKLAAQKEKFDVVFIDAEKSGYVDYVKAILDGDLLSSRGFVVVDNTLMQGQPYQDSPPANGQAISDFNEYLRNEPRVEQVMIPLRDGVTLIRRTDLKTGAGNE